MDIYSKDNIEQLIYKKISKIKNINLIWIFSTFVFLFIFFCIKCYSIDTQFYDESIYLYQAKLLTQGLIPYKDFSLAHPPIPLFVHAFFMKIFGYQFPFGLISLVCTIASAFMISLLVKRKINSFCSLLTLFIFLYNPLVLSISSSIVGVCISLLFLTLCVFYYDKGNIYLAALFAVLSVLTRFHTIPILFGLYLYTLIKDKKKFLHLLLASISIGIICLGFLILLCGYENLFNNIIGYHIKKQYQEFLANRIWGSFINKNAIYLIIFSLSQIALILNFKYIIQYFKNTLTDKFHTKDRIELIIISSILVISNFLFLNIFGHFFMYYAFFLLLFAAIPSSFFIYSFLISLCAWIANLYQQKKFSLVSLPKYKLLVYIISAILLPINIGGSSLLAQWNNNKKAPKPWVYQWQDSKYLPNFVNETIKFLFWEKERYYKYGYSLFTSSLWDSSQDQQRTKRVQNIAQIIKNNTSPEDTIFGDGASTPMLSLITNRNITLNIVETNVQQVMTNALNLNKVLPQLIKNKNKIIVARIKGRGWYGIASDKRLLNFIKRNYNKLHTQFVDRGFNNIVIFKLKDEIANNQRKPYYSKDRLRKLFTIKRQHKSDQAKLNRIIQQRSRY